MEKEFNSENLYEELRQSQMDIRHLGDSIQALREALEFQNYEEDKNIQSARMEGVDEVTQLKETITRLREEFQDLQFKNNQLVERLHSDYAEEMQQLRDT
ncbi:MAG TPA: hypothetical protein EYN92_01605, partial [Dehalococcoidia bacterium]|nr:hypothetical protein [Dehalococcoidia bacterium]